MAGALFVKVEVIRQLVWGQMETLLKGHQIWPNLGHISKIEKKNTPSIGQIVLIINI